MNLTWRTLKNALYGMAEYLWPVLVAIIAFPYIVRTLGADRYGLLSIVGITLGFFGFLDLGIGGAATRQIAASHEQGDSGDINTVVSTVLCFYLVIGLLGAATILLLTNVMVTQWLAIPPAHVPTARLAFIVSAPAFVVSMIGATFSSIPRAIQRNDVATKVSVATTTLTTLATVGVLMAGRGLLAIVIAGLAINILAIPVLLAIARRLIPTLRVSLRFDRGVFRDLMGFGSAFLASQISVLLLYQADKLLLGSFLSVAFVTYYVVPGSLAQRIQGLVAAATGIIFPVSAVLFQSGARESMVRLYREGSRIVFALIVMIAIPLAVFAEPFLRYWMGAEIASRSWIPMVLLVSTYSLLSATATAWGIANGSGRAWANASFTLAIAALDLGLVVWWVPRFGVAGADQAHGVIAAATAYLVSAVIGVPALIAYVERRVVGLSGVEFLRLALPSLLAGTAEFALAFGLRLWAMNLWATLGLMVLTALAFPLTYWGLGLLQESDRRLISLLVQRVRGKTPAST